MSGKKKRQWSESGGVQGGALIGEKVKEMTM